VPTARRDLALTFYQSQGPMARNVADCSLMLAAMAERTSIDPMAYPLDPRQFLEVQPVDLSRLRVAVSADLGAAPTSRGVRELFRARVARIGHVFRSCEWRDPGLDGVLDVFWLLRGVYMLAKHAERFERYGPELNPNVRSNVLAAQKMDLTKVALAHSEQFRLYRKFQELYRDVDVLLCPGVTVFPFPFDQLYPKEIDGAPMENYVHWAGLTSALTVMGHPVTAIPCGLDPTGTPFGIQVVGPNHDDRFTLGVAHALERLFESDTELKRPVPKLAGT
jgi:Asp-tRNA(Asn)/Glu-tRNA(Gln) amidotransferase A subunit family amidase